MRNSRGSNVGKTKGDGGDRLRGNVAKEKCQSLRRGSGLFRRLPDSDDAGEKGTPGDHALFTGAEVTQEV